MPAARPNYCQIVGINPFREDDYDPETIGNMITEAERTWKDALQRRASDRMRHQYVQNIRAVPDIRAVMANDVLRKSEFEKARAIVTTKASHLRKCVVTSRTGAVSLPPRFANDLVRNLGWEGLTVKDLVNASGINHTDLKCPVEDNIISIFEALRNIGFYSPHEFINHVLAIPGLNLNGQPLTEDADTDAFFADLDLIYAKKDRFTAQNIPDWETYNAIIIKLQGIRSSKRLADLVLYGRTYGDIEPALEMLDIDSGFGFTPSYLDDIITKYVVGKTEDTDLAVSIMERYCFQKGYPANFSGEDSRLVLCPSCGALTVASDGPYSCSLCGRPVTVACPRCGTCQSSVNETCSSCGESFSGSAEEIAAGMEEARRLLSEGDIARAQEEADDLVSAYPFAHEAADLAEEIRMTGDRVMTLQEGVANLYRLRRFHALKTEVEEAARELPFIESYPEVSERYTQARDAVAEADRLCLDAGAGGDLESYISAAMVCPDHPDALTVLGRHPPQGPAEGEVRNTSDGIVVSYAVPADRRGVEFCIFRGIGSYPDVDSETVPDGITANAVWLDSGADPGVPCYYRIYTRRWGVYSEECAEAGPGMFVREVTNVTIKPLEDGLRLEYTAPTGCNRVRLWRTVSGIPAGQGEEVEIDAGDGVVEDRGLVGMQNYAYLFVAEYADGARSAGTVFRGETGAYPDPVTDLAVKWNGDGTYTASWSSSANVRLYTSSLHPAFPGRAVPREDLEREYSEVDSPVYTENGAVFRLPGGHAHFVLPVIPAGDTFIVGDCVLVADLRPLTDISRTEEDGMYVLRFPWPRGSTAVVVTCDGENISVYRGEGEGTGTVKIPMGKATHKEVSLSAVYDVDGAGLFSGPVTASLWNEGFSKVRYKVSAESVPGDRAKQEISIEIECQDAASLPCMVMVMAEHGIPLRASDGKVLWTSDNPLLITKGKAKGAFFMPKGEADISRMRLFFRERESYGRYRIVHPLYGRD